ncbi:queuosine precursor transporter [Candidatus Woesearchaeota archaeon]|nr:queuosine precursor transporter [Candidatus Woesearchaeota archaeon]
MKSIDLKTDLLLGFFIVSLVLANTLGTKITSLFGVRVSFGIFLIPIMFLVTDIIAEVHGKQKAKSFVYIAIFTQLFLLVMAYIAIKMPANPTWGNQAAFASVFGASLRMTIASVIAFIVSQFHDVWAFDLLRRKTKGKYLWMRNNVSTMISQLIDSSLFLFIAFYKINPKFTVPFIISLIIPYWLFKIGFAVIDTPFAYLGVWWLKKD